MMRFRQTCWRPDKVNFQNWRPLRASKMQKYQLEVGVVGHLFIKLPSNGMCLALPYTGLGQ